VNLLLRSSSTLITLKDKARISGEVKTHVPQQAQHIRGISLYSKRVCTSSSLQNARDVNANKRYLISTVKPARCTISQIYFILEQHSISLLFCSNSCTSLNLKTLKLHTKTLKICPYTFRSPLKMVSKETETRRGEF
jgi:hypothetical protein